MTDHPPGHQASTILPRREQAGIRAALLTAIEPTPAGWLVPSESGDGKHLVHVGDDHSVLVCDCPDATYRRARCKHVAAVLFLMQLADWPAERDYDREPTINDIPYQGYPPPFGPAPPPGGSTLADLVRQLTHSGARLTDEAQTWASGEDVAATDTPTLLADLTFLRWLVGAERFLWATSNYRPTGHHNLRLAAVEGELRSRGAVTLSNTYAAVPRPAPRSVPEHPQPQKPPAPAQRATPPGPVRRGGRIHIPRVE